MNRTATAAQTNCCNTTDVQNDKASANTQRNRAGRDDGRTYLINTKALRVSSTKQWAKTLDQLRRQIKRGCNIDGNVLNDHFC